MDQTKPSLAMVVPNLAHGGGVTTVADFLYDAAICSNRFARVDLFSLATSASDVNSIRIIRPGSWIKGIRISEGHWKGRSYLHVGARWTELEVSRYQPREVLTNLLNQYDVVQIVAGSPAWANIARDVHKPVALQVATLANVERERRHLVEGGISGLWRRLMTRVTSRVDLAALDSVDVVFVENQWMHEFVAGRIGEDKVVFAPPGVDADFFHPLNERGDDDPYILSVGRFADPRKNVPLLFRAYRRLRDQMPDAPILIMAGMSEPTPEDWALALRLDIRKFIQFRHGVSPDELARLYRECTLFVLSSDEEGFGMVLIEAMASGVPVISTRSGGPQTIITNGEDGLLVEVGDVDGLARGMEHLLLSPGRSIDIGHRARRTVETRFSLAASGQVFLDGYERLLASGSKG